MVMGTRGLSGRRTASDGDEGVQFGLAVLGLLVLGRLALVGHQVATLVEEERGHHAQVGHVRVAHQCGGCRRSLVTFRCVLPKTRNATPFASQEVLARMSSTLE